MITFGVILLHLILKMWGTENSQGKHLYSAVYSHWRERFANSNTNSGASYTSWLLYMCNQKYLFRMWNFTTYLRSRDSERQIKIDPSIGSVPNYLQQLEPDQAQIRNLELLGLLHEQQGPSYLNHHHLVPSQGAHWQTGIPGPPASIAQSPRSILLFTSYFIRDFWLICLKNH